MVSDDLPYVALENQLRLEDSSTSAVNRFLVKWLSRVPLTPFDRTFRVLKDIAGEDSADKVQIMLKTLQEELQRVTSLVETLYTNMSEEEKANRERILSGLLLDAVRKADQTRAEQRVKHIGMILAGAVIDPGQIDGDAIEELMRVAMDLGDQDISYLRELVRIEGSTIRSKGRIDRYNAHTIWERGSWGSQNSPEQDSHFRKLESYGLVSPIAPPNNVNILSDFPNRYLLLPKGLRFLEAIEAYREAKQP